MTEEVAKIKANKDGSYIDIVPEKCVSAQKAQYDENGRDLLDAESSQTIKGANTFAAKQTFTGGVAVSGTSAIAGNVNMDSGDLAIGAKMTASNTGNAIKVANHDTALTSNDVLSAQDINTPNGDANSLVHRSGDESILGAKTFSSLNLKATYDTYVGPRCFVNTLRNELPTTPQRALLLMKDIDGKDIAFISILRDTDGSLALILGGWPIVNGQPAWKQKTLCKFNTDGTIS